MTNILLPSSTTTKKLTIFLGKDIQKKLTIKNSPCVEMFSYIGLVKILELVNAPFSVLVAHLHIMRADFKYPIKLHKIAD